MTFEPEILWKRTGAFVFFAIREASNLGETGCEISTSFPFSFNWSMKTLKLMGIWISKSCQIIKRLSANLFKKGLIATFPKESLTKGSTWRDQLAQWLCLTKSHLTLVKHESSWPYNPFLLILVKAMSYPA